MERILIVDDSPDFLDALSYILKKHYEVATTGGVEEAKEELLTSVFDVICSDYYMADGTGLDLLEFCKQEKISVPFILMSATREQHIVIEAELHGVVFVEKTDSDLLSVIRENAD